ncbi:TRAP transporter small permease [Pseudorhodoferax soli]|uniref:TRAP transporter small permease protein n=1 Tax=Pseudorhodoferax soli TaxID=545864 RepID=A0A368Y9M9_9BURK|nr:TRAP transporter small permease [Pseudorhodoferax soli]RCW76409.1 TRAP-type C4-dicarboxylate transport system permease small subunit [Pseudorhodoferax soli]
MNATANTAAPPVPLQQLPMGLALRVLFRASRWMNAGLRHLVGAMLCTMVLVVFVQILVRFLLPRLGITVSVPWSEELARYLMVWCIFLGAAVASRAGDLIAVESLVDALPARIGWRLKMVSYVATIAFLATLVWLGWRWVEFGEGESSTVMNLPMSWVYLALPVGAALTIVNILTRLLEGVVRQRALGDAPQAEPVAPPAGEPSLV